MVCGLKRTTTLLHVPNSVSPTRGRMRLPCECERSPLACRAHRTTNLVQQRRLGRRPSMVIVGLKLKLQSNNDGKSFVNVILWISNCEDFEEPQNARLNLPRQTAPASAPSIPAGGAILEKCRRYRPRHATDRDVDRWRRTISGRCRESGSCRRAPRAPY
jgi:hypothetical protein